MSIQSEITRIDNNVDSVLNILKNNGITVSSSANSDDLATLLNTLLSQIVTVKTVSSKPSDSTGNNGDIFIQV